MPDNLTVPARRLANALPVGRQGLPTPRASVHYAALKSVLALHERGYLTMRPDMSDEEFYAVTGTLDAARSILERGGAVSVALSADQSADRQAGKSTSNQR